MVDHHSNNSYAVNRQLSVGVKSSQSLSVYQPDDEENILFQDGQQGDFVLYACISIPSAKLHLRSSLGRQKMAAWPHKSKAS